MRTAPPSAHPRFKFSECCQGTDRLGPQGSKIDDFAFATAKSLRMSSASFADDVGVLPDSTARRLMRRQRPVCVSCRVGHLQCGAAASSNAMTSQPRSRRLIGALLRRATGLSVPR